MKPIDSLLNIRNIFLVLIILFSFSAWAQQEVFVSGRVLDNENQQGLESCAVGFYNDKQELITGTVTDAKGYFELTLLPGKYKMVLDYIGYEKKEIPVSIRQNNQFLGTYKLSVSPGQLSTVQVKAQNKSFKVDKEVYTVTRKMKVSAANTQDVLDKIKGVSYDRYNNNIKVDGQTNIKILVNGLEKSQQYIDNLNPERIKKIEIIRDPGGRYGLEGYSAVINLILKRNYTGLELNVFNQSILDPDVKDSRFILPVNASNLNLNYTYNKINVYTGYGNYINNFAFPASTVQTYENEKLIEETAGENQENFIKKTVNDKLTFGVDYYLNPRHTLSFETGMNNIFFNKDEQNTTYEVKSFNQGNLEEVYLFFNPSENESTSNYQTVFYTGKLDDKNDIRFDIKRFAYENNNRNDFWKNRIFERAISSNTSQNLWRMNAEWEHRINEKTSWQAGYGFLRKTEENLLTTRLADETQNTQSKFSYEDMRHKLFAYYAHRFNKKWSLKLGMAGEISTPEAYGQQTTYMIYQPYLDLKYKLSPKLTLKLKYRSESEYPALSQVNPQEIYLDERTVSKGNPYLTPSVTHKISIRSQVLGGAINLEPYYHFSDNYIGQTGHLRPDGIFEYSYDNTGAYRHYGIRINWGIPLSKKIFWQNNMDVYHSQIEYQKRENAFTDFSMESNLIYVNQKNGLTAGLLYQRGMNKHITTLGYQQWANDYWGFLMQKPFYKKRLNLMLLYMLPVDFGVDYIQKTLIQTNGYESLGKMDLHLLKNILVFRLNYRFSKGKSTRKTQKNIEDESPEGKSKGLF